MFAFLQRKTDATGLTAADAVKRAANDEIVLIDVREPGETAKGAAKGAVLLPSATLMMRADPRSPECLPQLQQGKPIAVYCASGARSQMAKTILERMGHAEVHNIGGLAAWLRAGGEIS